MTKWIKDAIVVNIERDEDGFKLTVGWFWPTVLLAYVLLY